ncbi:MAG: carbohydrate-binding protein [Puia sp.]|nr:carbohydrate-binding protein [Puia sp.]
MRTDLEDYAGKELCRYLHLISDGPVSLVDDVSSAHRQGPVFLLGLPGHSSLIDRLIREGQLKFTDVTPGPQGYLLKKCRLDGRAVIVIAAKDDPGLLYGVYGFLEEHIGISFHFDGDILPAKKSPAECFPDIDETKTPAVEVRGLLPWTNFPQSATSYSWEDWKYVLDQMAKMRLNFLQIHNYSGEEGHNEMFEDFAVEGQLSRVWMATARSGHAWGNYPGWDPNRYCFGSRNLFDDYDFGADCALHNEGLDNKQVFRKGAGEFQRVIAYAHTRGIRIGLGLDINLIADSYHLAPDDPRVVAARVKQLSDDYPNLDYLLCFQSEGLSDPAADKERHTWRRIFDGFYNGLKKTCPKLRLAVAGWGIRPEDVATLPADVICAPISHYSDGCENGSVYGNREYWGCPWLERDFNSSVYYYPYHMDISNTIEAWKDRAPNMKGFYALTWRLTDAVEAKVWYLARAPWDKAGAFNNSETLYRLFAERQYGRQAAPFITPIINQNEPFASDFSECRWTPPFSLARVEQAAFLCNVLTLRPSADASPIPATRFVVANQVQTAAGADGKSCIGYIQTGSWVAYDGIPFSPASRVFHVELAGISDAGVIELRLDEPRGQVIGQAPIPSTGGWTHWQDLAIDILPVTGPHRLYLAFREKDPVPLAQAQLDKADSQLSVINTQIALAADPGDRSRLALLRCRIAAEHDHIALNMNASNRHTDLQGMTGSWIANFNNRVTDISSLGNVVSAQDRFIQKDYIDLAWKQLNTYNTVAPENIQVRGTRTGARVTWQVGDSLFRGFDIYRDGKKITAAPLSADTRAYDDTMDGFHHYEVYSLFWGNDSGNASQTVSAWAGKADTVPPRMVMISPPGSVLAGQPVWIKVRLLDNRVDEELSATLYYRVPGGRWRSIPMTRRVKSTFTAILLADQIGPDGLQYYISSSDGDHTDVFPADAPIRPLSIVREIEPAQKGTLSAPWLSVKDSVLNWKPVNGADYYRIYRSKDASFIPGPDNILTYLAADATLRFTDNGWDLTGGALKGVWYYRVSAVDRYGYESQASTAGKIGYP